MQNNVFIVGTFDTKARELFYIRDIIKKQNLHCITVDVSAKYSNTSKQDSPADISPEEIASYCPEQHHIKYIFNEDRGTPISRIIPCLVNFMLQQHVTGIIGIGGSGGTALVAPCLRSLGIGIPKFLLSTVASGNTKPYIGASDITLMYSVADIAGLNRITQKVLSNAANAIAGMSYGFINENKSSDTQLKPAVGLSMFGVTTPCVNQITSQIYNTFDPLVFHATGTGGQAMEALATQGELKALIDITTTEIADHLFGGVFSAGSQRLDAAIKSNIPYIGSVGALDMVNFGSIDTVPDKYKHRHLFKHNPQVTLMRTNVQKCIKIGEWIAEKLNKCTGQVRFLLPEKGISLISTHGQPFYDSEADQALFDTLSHHFIATDNRKIIYLPYAINDKLFSDAVVEYFFELVEK